MSKIKLIINYRDNRGIIKDLIIGKKINAISYITQKKNTVRGNHIHKKTTQWNYLVSGKMLVVTKKRNKIKKTILKKGEMSVVKPNEKHATKALKNSEFLVFTQGPRSGSEYEKDTYRLKKKIL